jgi:hypothetical protein
MRLSRQDTPRANKHLARCWQKYFQPFSSVFPTSPWHALHALNVSRTKSVSLDAAMGRLHDPATVINRRVQPREQPHSLDEAFDYSWFYWQMKSLEKAMEPDLIDPFRKRCPKVLGGPQLGFVRLL